jgi:integrase
MASLWLRNGVFYVSFYLKGKRHKISTGSRSPNVAKRVLESIQKKIVLDQFEIENYNKKGLTLSQYEEIYFSNVAGVKMKSTIAGHRIYYAAFRRIVGDIELTKVDLVMLEWWRATRLSQVSRVTVNIEHSSLRAMFSKAMEYGLIRENPFKKLKALKIEERRLYLTVDEERLFMAALDELAATARNRNYREDYDLFKKFVQFQLDTGMRREETTSLKINQIDFSRNLIMVEKSKGKKTREIPMTRRVRGIVDGLGPDLFEKMSSGQVSRKFRLVATKAGLPRKFKQHSLRHTYATRLLALGVDISIVSNLLGHSSLETTMIYAKATLETLRTAISTLDGFQERYALENAGSPKLGTVENEGSKLLGDGTDSRGRE